MTVTVNVYSSPSLSTSSPPPPVQLCGRRSAVGQKVTAGFGTQVRESKVAGGGGNGERRKLGARSPPVPVRRAISTSSGEKCLADRGQGKAGKGYFRDVYLCCLEVEQPGLGVEKSYQRQAVEELRGTGWSGMGGVGWVGRSGVGRVVDSVENRHG